MARTVSMSVGKVAIFHDLRLGEIPHNVDPTLTYLNEILIDKLKAYEYDIVAYTNARFQPTLDAYNDKQRKRGRLNRIKTQTYTELIEDENKKLIAKAEYNKANGINKSVRPPTQLVHEYVIQIGNKDTNGTLVADIDKNKKYATEVLEELQDKYPNMEILLATFHADEPNGTPHLHILVQYVGTAYKQGLSQQISISKAMEQSGFERCNERGNYAIERFMKNVQDTILTDKLLEIMGEEREIIGEHREHIPTPIFREKARKEAEALEQKRQELLDVQQQAYDYVDSKEKELDEREEKIEEQEKQNEERKRELDEREERVEEREDYMAEREENFSVDVAEFEEYEMYVHDWAREVEFANRDLDACIDNHNANVEEFEDYKADSLEQIDAAKRECMNECTEFVYNQFEKLDSKHKQMIQCLTELNVPTSQLQENAQLMIRFLKSVKCKDGTTYFDKYQQVKPQLQEQMRREQAEIEKATNTPTFRQYTQYQQRMLSKLQQRIDSDIDFDL